MSYHVWLVRREARAKFEAAGGADFFEHEANLSPLTEANLRHLARRLELAGFVGGGAGDPPRRYRNDDWPAEALLTASALYLSCPFGDAVFEVGMFASESVSDNEELAKFDPQDGSWE
jgi:hypothetical protein